MAIDAAKMSDNEVRSKARCGVYAMGQMMRKITDVCLTLDPTCAIVYTVKVIPDELGSLHAIVFVPETEISHHFDVQLYMDMRGSWEDAIEAKVTTLITQVTEREHND